MRAAYVSLGLALGIGVAWLFWGGATPDIGVVYHPSATMSKHASSEASIVEGQGISAPEAAVASDPPPALSDGDARVEVPTEAANGLDVEARAKEFLALPTGGDVGIDTLRRAILMALEPASDLDPFAEPMPSVEDLEASDEFNPTRCALSQEDKQVILGVIRDYVPRLRKAKRDEYLSNKLAIADAIARGHFVAKPNGSDPEGVGRRLKEEARARSPGGKWLSAEMPGPDFSHNRAILIEPKDYPDLFTAQNYRRLLSAEYALALRSAFLSAAQLRR